MAPEPSLNNRHGQCLSLLCFDGGGVRGLSSLYILQRLMEELDPENPPHPCKCFDMIGGTSTGGLIALMLGRLEMTVQECIDAYLKILPSVFEKTKHRVSLGGKLQGRFNSTSLENEIRKILKERKLEADEMLKNPASACKAWVPTVVIMSRFADVASFVCVTSKTGLRTTVLATYPSRRRSRDMYNAVKIWEAARATSAATTFFDPITILDEDFVDGATGANNPINEMWTEAGDVWSDGPQWRLEDNIGCFVSIGTGVPAFGTFQDSATGIMETLTKIATDCEKTVENFQRHHRYLDGRFFRFNVDSGLDKIGLEEAEKRKIIIAAARQYLERETSLLHIEKFAVAMRNRKWHNRIRDYIRKVADKATVNVSRKSDSSHHVDVDEISWLFHTDACDAWLSDDGCSGVFLDWRKDLLARNYEKSLAFAIPNALFQFYPARYTNVYFVHVDCNNYVQQNETSKWRASTPLPPHREGYVSLNPASYRSQTSHSNTVTKALQEPEEHIGPALAKKKLQYPLADPREILVILACLTMSAGIDDIEIAHRLEELPPNCLEVLQTVTAESLVMDQSKAEPLTSLIKHSSSAIRGLFTSASRYMPAGSIVVLLIDNVDTAYDIEFVQQLVEISKDYSLGDVDRRLRFAFNTGKQGPREFRESQSIHYMSIISRQTEWSECLESLKVSGTHSRKDEIQQAEEGTFDWLPSHPSFKDWKVEGGVLWVRGKPGSGKSTLAKHILNHIGSWYHSESLSNKSEPAEPHRVIAAAWFYSIKLGLTNRSHHAMLRCLLHSILVQDEQMFQSHKKIYREARWSLRKWVWSRKSLECFFEAIATSSTSPDIIGVIDALDESEDESGQDHSRDCLTKFLLSLAYRQTSNLRLILLSRPYKSLRRQFQCCEQIILEQENSEDIKKIVDSGLAWLQSAIMRRDDSGDRDPIIDDIPILRRRKEIQKRNRPAQYIGSHGSTGFNTFLETEFREMRQYLLNHASGVILWVTLVLRELEQLSETLSNIQDLKQTLFMLPSELEDLYQAILQRLEARGLEKAKCVLAWTIGVNQTQAFTLSMLFDALTIPEDIDLAQCLILERDPFMCRRPLCETWRSFALMVYEQCGALIDIIPPGGVREPFHEYLDDEIDDQWIVVLLHRTVQDFLSNLNRASNLYLEASFAQKIVKKGLAIYLQVYLPIVPTSHSFHPGRLAWPGPAPAYGLRNPLIPRDEDDLVEEYTVDPVIYNRVKSLFTEDEDVLKYIEERRLLRFAL